MIEINNLRKVYNRTEVLSIPELTFEKGEIIGIVGNNGAGKTTLFSAILDLIQASAGSITSKGNDVSQTEDWKKYTAAFLDEIGGIYIPMNLSTNLFLSNKNYLNLLRRWNYPWGSIPLT